MPRDGAAGGRSAFTSQLGASAPRRRIDPPRTAGLRCTASGGVYPCSLRNPRSGRDGCCFSAALALSSPFGAGRADFCRLFMLIWSRSSRSAERLDTIYIPPLYTPIIDPASVPRHEPAKLLMIELSFRRTRYFPIAPTENQVQPDCRVRQDGCHCRSASRRLALHGGTNPEHPPMTPPRAMPDQTGEKRG